MRGAYVVDDSGPNPAVIAGGAVAVLAVVAGLMWLGGQQKSGAEAMRPLPSVSYRPPARYGWAAPVSYASVPIASQTPGQYVYNPPPISARPTVPAEVWWAWQTPPPANPYQTAMFRPRRPGVVYRSLVVTPSLPITPAAVWAPRWVMPPASPVGMGSSGLIIPDETRNWIFDPVHDTWVLRGDRVSGGAPGAPPNGYPGQYGKYRY